MRRTGAKEARRGRSALPGLGSLEGRYLAIAAFFSVFLIAAAVLGRVVVQRTADGYIASAAQRGQLADVVRNLLLGIRDVEAALQRFIILPDESQRSAIWDAYVSLNTDAAWLKQAKWLHEPPVLGQRIRALTDDVTQLRGAIEQVIVARADVEKWFPAMNIMLNRLLPDNMDFYTAATLAMDEAYELEDEPGQRQAHKLFADARHSWTLMTSEFRLYVANRFGIFSSQPEQAMRARAKNIKLHAENVSRILAQLAELNRWGLLKFQGQEALTEMRRLHRSWLQAYDDAVAILNSDRWRSDLPLLRDQVDPIISRLRENLGGLQDLLAASTTTDVAGLAAVAERLSNFFALLALAGILVILTGFLIFRRAVLRPITLVTRALRAEAHGEPGVHVPQTATDETRDLSEAFAEMRSQVHVRQKRLENILENAAEGIVTINEQGVIETFNAAAEQLFGYQADEVIGRNVSILMPSPYRERHDEYIRHYLNTGERRMIGGERELEACRKDGTVFPVSIKLSETVIQGRSLFTALIADISERKAMLQNLKHMAEHDGLTGLYNRDYFQAELERVVHRARHAPGFGSALLYIDLDNFKYVNDTLGHVAGDRLLVEVAGALRARARKGDLLARFGGDEFVVLLYDTNAERALHAAEAFRRALAEYVFIQGTARVDIGCSVGVTVITRETKSADDVLARADVACHLAKRSGRNQVYLFNPSDEARMASMLVDMGWSRRIKDAVEHNRFALACQPIVETRPRRIVAYEVLVRMLDENEQYVMPTGFLPSAERFGLSADVDRWVIRAAVRELAERRKSIPRLCYSINLSAQTLSDRSLCELIGEALRTHRVSPQALIFEVTETAAITDMSAAEAFLSALKNMGCRTALDDYGAGFASFAYLKNLPVDVVKIDGRYVKGLALNRTHQTLVKAMNEIAHAMGMRTVAECVEDKESLVMLQRIGVDLAQGYYIGRPRPLVPTVPGYTAAK